MTRPTVAVVTLGCARNEVDSDNLAALLRDHGYRLVPEAAGADAVLVNTCTFITPASEESVETVLAACDLKRTGTRAVVVVGCMAERYRHDLADAVPEADAIVGFGGYPELPRVLDQLLAGQRAPRFVGAGEVGQRLAEPPGRRRGPARLPVFGEAARTRDGRPWSYLKIANGCDRTCTFCAIPSWRGRFRSRPLADIVAEARFLAQGGARELVLVSENTTSWGKDLPDEQGRRGRDLQPLLLERLAAVEGVERIRLAYLQPAELTRPLLEAMAAIPEVASYYDLSLQHASPSVLRRMARRGSSERFRALIDGIRELDPAAVFRSNFIVGFPGETDDDVATLASFLQDARLDWVGLFAFSPQDGTAAATLPDQVPEQVARDRLHHLSDIQELVADERAASFVGRTLEVTVEDAGDACVARSYREAPDTDGEIRLVRGAHDPRPAGVPVGRTTTATVVASEGVDLLAVPVGRRHA